MGYYTANKPDLRSKASMIAWLANHFTYYKMNSWNSIRGFAHKVKIHSMNLPADVEEKAWQYLQLDWDCTDFSILFQDCLDALKGDTLYGAFFNGRSGGYLVFDMPMKDLDDLAEYSMSYIRGYVRDVMRFDSFCDDVRDNFIWYLRNNEFVEEEYTVVKKRLVEKPIE